MSKYLTKRGTAMKTKTRLKILDVMTDPANDGKTQKEIAALVNVHQRTLRSYLTEELWADIQKLRLDILAKQLERVDQAVYAKAVQGDMTAARLIYGRWRDMSESEKESSNEKQKDYLF